jgi:hypothetical protein
MEQVRADFIARQESVHAKVGQAADRAHSQWRSMKLDAETKIDDLHERVEAKRDERDVKKAERHAEAAEEDAVDAVDFACWAIQQAELAVLDAIAARVWADKRAALSRTS